MLNFFWPLNRIILDQQVTREWFPLKESAIASGGITLSMILGSAIGLSVTPLFAVSPSDVPILNVVWFVPLALTFVMAVVVFVCHGQGGDFIGLRNRPNKAPT